MAGGIDRSIERLAGVGAPTVATGTIAAIEVHSSFGYLVTVTLQPGDEVTVQARLCAAGSGSGEGIFWPVEVGDEVLVVFPDGDPVRAVAVAGLTNALQKPPSSWTNDHVAVVHSGGMTVRRNEVEGVSPVVLSTLLPELKKAIDATIAGLIAAGVTPGADLANLSTRLAGEVDASAALFAAASSV